MHCRRFTLGLPADAGNSSVGSETRHARVSLGAPAASRSGLLDRTLEFVHLGKGRSIVFQGDEAPKARFIPAWGNAPGDEKKRGKGLKARPMEAVMPQSLLGAIRRTIPTGLIYGAGLQPSVIFVNLPPGALP